MWRSERHSDIDERDVDFGAVLDGMDGFVEIARADHFEADGAENVSGVFAASVIILEDKDHGASIITGRRKCNLGIAIACLCVLQFFRARREIYGVTGEMPHQRRIAGGFHGGLPAASL